MKTTRYEDFDLIIEPAPGGYRARVLNSPTGQAPPVEFKMPFDDVQLENLLLKMGQAARTVRSGRSPAGEAARELGEKLFEAVFKDDLRACLRSSQEEAERRGAGLRLRLRLDAPELASLPWEYLYNRTANRFLTLSTRSPLVRYLQLAETARPLQVKPPLKVLVVIAGPTDYPPLNIAGEWEKLQSALRDLQDNHLVELSLLEKPTLRALQHRLQVDDFHVLHFIGHGAYDPSSEAGQLVFEDDNQRGRLVSGQYLGPLLYDEGTFRLAVLNACEGARASGKDPFSGVAQSLVQQGFPAVIAMQFEITDAAAITFAHEFYTALARGFPVDAAVAETRKALYAAEQAAVEWGTPVLFMRSEDGLIFDIQSEAQSPPAEKKVLPSPPKPEPSKRSETKLPAPTPNVQPLPSQAAGPQPTSPQPGTWGAPPAQAPGKPTPQPQPQQPFNPTGIWNVQIGQFGVVQGQAVWNLYPNGSLQLVMQNAMGTFQGSGGWGWNDQQNLLQLQGVNQFGAPFMLQVVFMSIQGNGILAQGSDGFDYFIVPQQV